MAASSSARASATPRSCTGVRAPLGYREQLTFQAEPVTTAVAHPYDADSLLFLTDSGGDEIYADLAAQPEGRQRAAADRRQVAPWHAGVGARWQAHRVLRQRAAMASTTTSMSSTSTHQRRAAAGDRWRTATRCRCRTGRSTIRSCVIRRYVSITESYLELADLATGARTPRRNRPGRRRRAPWRFARHASRAMAAACSSSRTTAASSSSCTTSTCSTAASSCSRPQSRGDVEQLRHQQRRTLRRLHPQRRRPRPAGAARPRAEGRHAAAAAAGRRGDRLAALQPRRQAPRAVARDRAVARRHLCADRCDTPDAGQLARWTHERAGAHRCGRSSRPRELVHFPDLGRERTAGRAAGSAFVYRPQHAGSASGAHRHPRRTGVAVPPRLERFTQYLVNELGYVVVAPNVRGSSGYGRSFLQLDDGMLREDSVRDIGSLLVWIGLQNDFDRNRVVVMGGSYGGYMTLASMVHYGDRLAGGVDIVGISNFVTFLTNTSGYRRDYAPRGIRRRARPADAPLPAGHLAADQCEGDQQAAADRAGNERSARAGDASRSRCWQQLRLERRRGVVPGRRRTKAMASARKPIAMSTWPRWRSSCAG